MTIERLDLDSAFRSSITSSSGELRQHLLMSWNEAFAALFFVETARCFQGTDQFLIIHGSIPATNQRDLFKQVNVQVLEGTASNFGLVSLGGRKELRADRLARQNSKTVNGTPHSGPY